MTGVEEAALAAAVAPEVMGAAAGGTAAATAAGAGAAGGSALLGGMTPAAFLGAAPEVASPMLPMMMEMTPGVAPQFATSAVMADIPARFGGAALGATNGLSTSADPFGVDPSQAYQPDPRAMENGTPDFNDPATKARLMGAKLQGAFSNGGFGQQMASQMGKGLLQPQQPQGGGAQRPPSSAQAESAAQIMQRLQRGMGPRSNFAGLLGQALGRY